MRVAGRHGGMLQVHCEEASIIDPLVADALGGGNTSCRHHALTRPAHAEAAATRKAIEMARRAEAPLYIVHLSCAEALESVAEAKSRGEPVYAETCPHYLTLTDALYAEPDESEVIKRVISPPLRTAADVDALWAGLRDGILDVVGSDHVPDRLDTEKRLPAPALPGDQQRGAGHRDAADASSTRRESHRDESASNAWSEVLSSTPARLFGLPAKGAIEAGRDADLVLIDPDARSEIRQADLAHTSDYTPYEGMPVAGIIRDVLVRGRRPGDAPGEFIERRLRPG